MIRVPSSSFFEGLDSFEAEPRSSKSPRRGRQSLSPTCRNDVSPPSGASGGNWGAAVPWGSRPRRFSAARWRGLTLENESFSAKSPRRGRQKIAWGGARAEPHVRPNPIPQRACSGRRQKIAWGGAKRNPRKRDPQLFISEPACGGRHTGSEARRIEGRHSCIPQWGDLACVNQTDWVAARCVAPFGGSWGDWWAAVSWGSRPRLFSVAHGVGSLRRECRSANGLAPSALLDLPCRWAHRTSS